MMVARAEQTWIGVLQHTPLQHCARARAIIAESKVSMLKFKQSNASICLLKFWKHSFFIVPNVIKVQFDLQNAGFNATFRCLRGNGGDG